MMHAMWNVYTNLGLYERAQSLLERAIEVTALRADLGIPKP